MFLGGAMVSDNQFISAQSNSSEEEPLDLAALTAQKQVNIADVDSLLDEIDGVLEQNAEEFVKGFVQKGGE